MKIAVLDTGIGGIDILNKLINKYPNNEFIYFCDNLKIVAMHIYFLDIRACFCYNLCIILF